MGKIRMKTLGDEALENKQKQKSKIKSKEKKLVKGAKGGERVVSVGPSEEELAKVVIASKTKPSTVRYLAKQPQTEKPKTDKLKSDNRKVRSKNYQIVAKIVDKNKKYSLNEALELLERLKRSKFDETVELHINTTETGLSGSITLPHGTGKVIRVAIADPSTGSGQVQFEQLLRQIESGKIEFDVLVATPGAMPKLARVAKILGPKGLMPNPKNGTLTKDPEKLALSFAKGQINFKTEAKTPIMHLAVGKMSFGGKKLSENIQSLTDAIRKEKIISLTLKSTMSPGIKLDLNH